MEGLFIVHECFVLESLDPCTATMIVAVQTSTLATGQCSDMGAGR